MKYNNFFEKKKNQSIFMLRLKYNSHFEPKDRVVSKLASNNHK